MFTYNNLASFIWLANTKVLMIKENNSLDVINRAVIYDLEDFLQAVCLNRLWLINTIRGMKRNR